jgi:3-deoxy-D-manno-octulosonic-acid transferase
MQNFAEIAQNLVARRGSLQVQNAAELEETLGRLLADPALREELGRNALQVVRENLGAVERTVAMIVDQLGRNSDLYVAPRG